MKKNRTELFTTPDGLKPILLDWLTSYANRIPGLRKDRLNAAISEVDDLELGHILLEWERGWGVNATLAVNLRPDWDFEMRKRRYYGLRKEGLTTYATSLNPDEAAPEGEDLFEARKMVADVEVSWGSTTRSVACALSSVALYRDVTGAAATLESMLETLPQLVSFAAWKE